MCNFIYIIIFKMSKPDAVNSTENAEGQAVNDGSYQ